MKAHFGILSGGAGTRLWPVSRKNTPKQLYALAAKEPLLIETLKRVEGQGPLTLLTTEALKAPSQGQINRFHLKCEVIAEPAAQNTAPIIAVFNELCFRKDKDAVVCVLPADHSISPLETFRADLAKAVAEASRGRIVTLGITPREPSTAYGYIEAKAKGDHLEVAQFHEKPLREKAEQLIANGALWNSGIFVFHTATFREALREHAPEIFAGVAELKADLSNLKEIYAKLPSISIDYALIEKLTHLECIRAHFDWSDLGSWEEVALKAKNPHAVTEVSAHGNYYNGFGKLPKTVAFVGVDDVMAIDTPDALLIVRKGFGQNVKEVVEKIKGANPGVVQAHSSENRPWGRFDVLVENPLFKSKVITVWPGQRLSYQSHKFRWEHWIIVEGEGEFTLNDEKRNVKAGDYLHIPLGAKHRISNPGPAKLEFIEVQQGTYFGEDDIIRYDDDYGRN